MEIVKFILTYSAIMLSIIIAVALTEALYKTIINIFKGDKK